MTDTTNQQTPSSTTHDLRDRASHAYETGLESAQHAATRAAETMEANPLAVLAGGIAIGAIAGALLPRTDQEQRVLGPLGKRISETAAAAASAARDAGKEQLAGVIPDKDAAKEKMRSAMGTVVQAARESGKSAATGSATDQPGAGTSSGAGSASPSTKSSTSAPATGGTTTAGNTAGGGSGGSTGSTQGTTRG